ncbi:MAG: aldehyde dehydrogenase family protein, partial [Actinomycetota bacterium]
MTITVLPHAERLGVSPGKILIDGDWRDGGGGATWTHVHPATNEEVTTIAVATAEDVAAAVTAARRAFDDGAWTGRTARDRQRLLQRVAALIDAHSEEINALQTLDNGVPV